jgi:hypothetical protein
MKQPPKQFNVEAIRWTETAKRQAVNELRDAFEKSGVSEEELAARMEIGLRKVQNRIRGDKLTIHDLAEIAFHLGLKVEVSFSKI